MRNIRNIIKHRGRYPNIEGIIQTGKDREGRDMDVLILTMVLATVGIAAAALGGIFAIYSSRQD